MENRTKDPRFEGLELLPLSVLEQIVQEDLNGGSPLDEELVDYVLGLIAQKQKEEHPELSPDVQAAWEHLQERISGGEAVSPASEEHHHKKGKTVRLRPLLRRAAVAVACVALTFAAMVSVQAAGIDLFGALGRWTESTFRFETLKPDEERDSVAAEPDWVEKLEQTYAANELPREFVPTWLPENYALVSLETLDNPYFTQVDAIFSDGGEYALTCSVCQYSGGVDAGSAQYEKSAENPERYNPNGMEFYLFENAGTWTGAWSNATYVITLGGLASREDLQRMIDSIYPAENTHRG